MAKSYTGERGRERKREREEYHHFLMVNSEITVQYCKSSGWNYDVITFTLLIGANIFNERKPVLPWRYRHIRKPNELHKYKELLIVPIL